MGSYKNPKSVARVKTGLFYINVFLGLLSMTFYALDFSNIGFKIGCKFFELNF